GTAQPRQALVGVPGPGPGQRAGGRGHLSGRGAARGGVTRPSPPSATPPAVRAAAPASILRRAFAPAERAAGGRPARTVARPGPALRRPHPPRRAPSGPPGLRLLLLPLRRGGLPHRRRLR